MPEEIFPIPEGYDKDRVMQDWGVYREKISRDPTWGERNSGVPIIGMFNKIHEMGADVDWSTDVEQPSDSSGVSLALRLVGATGAGLGSLSGAGAIPGALFGVGMNAVANLVDQVEGIPSEAVPFSGIVSSAMGVENPMTTGNPILDAAAEGVIDSMIGFGSLAKSGRNIGKTLGKDVLQEYVAKRLDPQFIADLAAIDPTGSIPITMRQVGVGGNLGKRMAGAVTEDSLNAKMVKDTTEALTESWRVKFGSKLDDPEVVENLIGGFNNGTEMARTLKETGMLLPHQKQAVIGMASFQRHQDKLLRTRNSLRESFIATKPSLMVSSETALALNNAEKNLTKLNIIGDKNIERVVETIRNVRNSILERPKKARTVRVGNELVISTESATQFKDSATPDVILKLIDEIEEQTGNLSKLPVTKQADIGAELTRIKDNLEANIWGSLDGRQLEMYTQYREASKTLNSAPQKILDSISTGEYDGFIETMIKDKDTARNFLRNGIVSEKEAKSMVGEFLLSKGLTTTKEGAESIDFLKIKRYTDNPANREGLVTILGQDNMDTFRQFANVASNVAPITAQGGLARNVLNYSRYGALGSFIFMDPISAAKTTAGTFGVSIATNQFLKNILFNPKIGREAIEMLKTGSTSGPGRRQLAKVMSALNGSEAMLIHFGPKGERLQEQQIVIKNREGGDPIFGSQ